MYVRSDINAGTLIIDATANLIQSYKDTFVNVGGEVRTQSSSPSAIRAANIFIAARYLNVNGLIEAGHAMQTAHLTGAVAAYIDSMISSYQASGTNSSEYLNFPLYQIANMKFYYDPANDRIILDDVTVRGGYVELFGQIISTGGGTINVLDGFGTIDVINETSYSLAVKALDVGVGSKGTVKITDTSKTATLNGQKYYLTTKYTRAYDPSTGLYSVTEKAWYTGENNPYNVPT